MTDRRRIGADRPWEALVGYSRGTRVGNVIEISGTAAADGEGRIVAPGDLYGQTKHVLETIGRALQDLGGSFEDVVRTRVFLTDITRWEEAGRAHGEVFADIRPTSAIIVVRGFADPRWLVEHEADADVSG